MHRMIDEIDATILDLLQENARISQAEIARVVGLAPSAVLERIRKLESRRVIKGYAALVDPHELDQSMLAFIAVRSEEAPGDDSVSHALAQSCIALDDASALQLADSLEHGRRGETHDPGDLSLGYSGVLLKKIQYCGIYFVYHSVYSLLHRNYSTSFG